jgi:hypothetical protein
MPDCLSELHDSGLIGPVALAAIHLNYMAICSELGVSPEDAATHQIIARTVIELHRKGQTDIPRCLDRVRKRLTLAAAAAVRK